MTYALLTNDNPTFIDSESSRCAVERSDFVPVHPPDWRPAEVWRQMALRAAQLITAPITARDAVRLLMREMHVGANVARNILATADGWLLWFDHQQGLWARSRRLPSCV